MLWIMGSYWLLLALNRKKKKNSVFNMTLQRIIRLVIQILMTNKEINCKNYPTTDLLRPVNTPKPYHKLKKEKKQK